MSPGTFGSPSQHITNTMTNPRLSPQAKTVLKHLLSVGSITNVEAHAVHRVRSLSRRVSELGEACIKVSKEYKKDVNGQRYVRYSLDKTERDYARREMAEGRL